MEQAQINWKIESLDCLKESDGLSNVVKTIHWRLEGLKGGLRSSIYGAIEIAEPSSDYIEFSDLTQEDVISWLRSLLPEADMIQSLEDELDRLLNSNEVKLTLQ